jgi:hypothetical protein
MCTSSLASRATLPVVADALTLVQAGAPQVRLVWWSADLSPVARFAADEIKRYLARISGAEMSVERVAAPARFGSSGVALTPPNGPQLENASTRLADELAGLPDDSFALYSQNEPVILAGTTHRATLYAAYELLERIGVRFFAPPFAFYADNAERIPHSSNIRVPRLRIVQRPSLTLRRKYVEEGWSHTPRTLVQLIDWMAKQRLNVLVYPDYQGLGVVRWDTWREQLLPELNKRGLMIEVGGHGYQSFLNHAAGRADWFERDTDGHVLDNFDASNADALGAYVDNVLEYLRSHPEIAIFSAWPADAPDWPKRALDRFDSPSDTQAHIANQLVTAVRQAGMPVRLSALAYSYANTLDPPRRTNANDASVIVDLATFDRSHTEPISGTTNRKYVRLLERWRETQPANAIAICEYYRRYAWRSLPVILPQLIGSDFGQYRAAAVTGLGIYSEPADWLTFELNHLLVARLSWNVDLDVSAFTQTYLDERFGSAAAVMQQYLVLVEEAARTIFDRPQGDFANPTRVATVHRLYSQAREPLASRTNGFLMEQLARNLDYALADVEISYYEVVAPDRVAQERAKQRMCELLQQHMFDGIILAHPSATRRCQPEAASRSTTWVYAAYRERWP